MANFIQFGDDFINVDRILKVEKTYHNGEAAYRIQFARDSDRTTIVLESDMFWFKQYVEKSRGLSVD